MQWDFNRVDSQRLLSIDAWDAFRSFYSVHLHSFCATSSGRWLFKSVRIILWIKLEMKWIQDRLDAITTLSSERASKSFFYRIEAASSRMSNGIPSQSNQVENHFIFPSDAIRVWLMIASVDFGACSVEQKRGSLLKKNWIIAARDKKEAISHSGLFTPRFVQHREKCFSLSLSREYNRNWLIGKFRADAIRFTLLSLLIGFFF